MWRHIASNALTFFVVVLFLIGGVILLGQDQYRNAGPLDVAVCLKVDRGSSMSKVVNDLEEMGAVSSGRVFRLGIDYEDKARLLKAGSYLIPAQASMAGIAEQITKAGRSTCGTEIVYRVGVTRTNILVRELDPATNRFQQVASFNPATDPVPEAFTRVASQNDARQRIAVAEGATSWQIVQALNGIDDLSGDIDKVPDEGVLAPDSYEFTKGDDRAKVVARMQEAQQKLLADIWAQRSDATPVDTAEELLVLASLIEKETGVARERRQVASVFANRLERGMKLQTDPTVIYGITKGKGPLGRGLRRSELRKETVWNTYIIPALPPTPIANPGKASLEAALSPDTTDFIFFVADGTGGHAFATNLEDHNANVRRWREIEAERNNN